MKKFIVSEESTLKNFTDNHCAQASFCFRTLLKEREIKVNGSKVSDDCLLRRGDEVQYFLTPAQERKRAFERIYEDENVLAVDKESGVNSEAVFEETGAFAVHRLDRNTAGVMILGKSAEAQEELISIFRARHAEKIYHALVVGKMPVRHAFLTAYLKKDEKRARVTVSSREIGEPIMTEYEVLEEREDCTLLKITLHTGKTHQIRAHMAYLGHPVVGDEKYGDPQYNRSVHAVRQKLISKELILHEENGLLAYLNGKIFRSKKNL